MQDLIKLQLLYNHFGFETMKDTVLLPMINEYKKSETNINDNLSMIEGFYYIRTMIKEEDKMKFNVLFKILFDEVKEKILNDKERNISED